MSSDKFVFRYELDRLLISCMCEEWANPVIIWLSILILRLYQVVFHFLSDFVNCNVLSYAYLKLIR
jgi:hypothetical protein